MGKFRVRYVHKVEITYDAIVEADSKEEAEQKMEDFNFESEKETDYQGIEVEIIEVEEL